MSDYRSVTARGTLYEITTNTLLHTGRAYIHFAQLLGQDVLEPRLQLYDGTDATGSQRLALLTRPNESHSYEDMGTGTLCKTGVYAVITSGARAYIDVRPV
jgi:hypothetical protein